MKLKGSPSFSGFSRVIRSLGLCSTIERKVQTVHRQAWPRSCLKCAAYQRASSSFLYNMTLRSTDSYEYVCGAMQSHGPSLSEWKPYNRYGGHLWPFLSEGHYEILLQQVWLSLLLLSAEARQQGLWYPRKRYLYDSRRQPFRCTLSGVRVDIRVSNLLCEQFETSSRVPNR